MKEKDTEGGKERIGGIDSRSKRERNIKRERRVRKRIETMRGTKSRGQSEREKNERCREWK